MTKPLTAKQAQLLNAIRDYMAANACAPAFQELCDAVGLKSRSTMTARLDELEALGWIKRGQGHRNIKLTTASGRCPCCGK